MSEAVRVRFAPSPTGALHVGGARTAVYNWAFARRTSGTFILRIDDTDPGRSTQENTAQILRSLEWLGLDWDEGPEIGGPFGPYFQTQRAANYTAALEHMKTGGTAYPCFCSPEELEAKRASVRAGHVRAGEVAGGYDRTCRRLDPAVSAARVTAGEPHVWRLAVPEGRGDIVVLDAVRGETVFPAGAMDDYVLMRGDGTPTYNFATVVDDADMMITHVIRGDDHLSNTPRQILVYEALGRPVPVFAHLSMIWGAGGKKLSKRHGATSVEAFRDEGYLPEALLNYLALLGWSLDGETTIVTPDALTSSFSLDRISMSPAIFDFEKLEWMNGVYIRDLRPEDFAARMFAWARKAGLATDGDLETRREWWLSLAPLVAERTKRMTDIVPMVRFLFDDDLPMEPGAAEKGLGADEAPRVLAKAGQILCDMEPWDAGYIEDAIRLIPDALGMKPKVVFQVVRAAITGSLVSLPLFESIALLGRERTVARLEAVRPKAG